MKELDQVHQECHLPSEVEENKDDKDELAGEVQKAKVAGKKEERSTLTTEDHVRRYFSDEPIMVEIARCESGFRHYDSSGSVLRGHVNRSDIGVMQINRYYHGDTADAMGIDLFTKQGNMEYAKYLYNKEGVAPWSASRSCWGNRASELALNK